MSIYDKIAVILWSILVLIGLLLIVNYFMNYEDEQKKLNDEIQRQRLLDKVQKAKMEIRNKKEEYMKPTPEFTCSTYSSEQRKRLFKTSNKNKP